MFSAYNFTYDSISSLEYDLMIYDLGGEGQDAVPFGNKADIIEKRILRRIQPIHYGVNYHDEPLEFKLVFGAFHPLDRFEFEQISLWLTGHQDYKWLEIEQTDLGHVRYRCLITELTPKFVDWLPWAMEANIICDCPYAYGYPFTKTYTITKQTTITFRNESTMREYFKPDLLIIPATGTTKVAVINKTDNNRETSFTGLPASNVKIQMNNNNGILTDTAGGVNLFPYFNMNFFRLLQGDNELTITGNGTYTISGMFLHNVGA